MTDLVTTTESRELEYITGKDGKDIKNFVTFIIHNQMFGIPVLSVQDILTPDRIASVPLAPPEVKGSINLRGRIVTVIDVRIRLGLEGRPDHLNNMGVTVEHQNELYTLLVDTVGDVIGLSSSYYEISQVSIQCGERRFCYKNHDLVAYMERRIWHTRRNRGAFGSFLMIEACHGSKITFRVARLPGA